MTAVPLCGFSVISCTQIPPAGCCGIGVGGNLVNKSWIEAGEWDKITELAQAYRKAVDEA